MMTNSRVYIMVQKGIDLTKTLLPEDIKNTLENYKEKINETNLIKENLLKEK